MSGNHHTWNPSGIARWECSRCRALRTRIRVAGIYHFRYADRDGNAYELAPPCDALTRRQVVQMELFGARRT